jgi:hypothetical protein
LNTHWRFRHEGRTLGPYPWRILLLLHSRGSLADSAEVQPADGGPWVPLRQVLEAQSVPPQAAAPQARPQPHGSPWQFALGYVLPLLLLVFTFYWVIYSVRDDIDPRPWWMALAAISLVIPLWYLSGAFWFWSATAQYPQGGQRLPQRITILLLGLVLLVLLAINYRPLKALVGIATTPDPYGQFLIRVDDGGRSLVYEGALGYAAPASLHNALAAHPGVDTVVLDSVGGWMVSGRGLVRVLREAGVRTVVARHLCASACILAFESVPHRVLEDGAVLGFHSESNQFSWARSDGADDDNDNDSFVEVFASHGVPQAFVDQAVNTPPNTLWRPGVAELFRSRVIDAVRIDGRDLGQQDYFLAVVDRYFEAEDFAPLAHGLREFAPEHLARLRQDVASRLLHGTLSERADEATLRAIDADEQLALQRAGDAAQLERAGLIEDLLADFSERSPALCYSIWTGDNPGAVTGGFTPAQKRAYTRVMGDMLVSAAHDPRPPPSDADGADLMGRAVRPAYLRYGRTVLDVPAARRDGRVGDDAICDMALSTYRQIHAMRPGEAGAAMRWLAHGNHPGGE